MRTKEWCIGGFACCLAVASLFVVSVLAQAEDLSLRNQQIIATIKQKDGSYILQSASDRRTILQSVVAAQINHRWMRSSEYPKHEVSKASFADRLGQAQQIVIRSTGLPQSPDLVCILRQYERFPFIDIEVEVQNHTGKATTVQGIRSVDSMGNQLLDLGAPEGADRVMSDEEYMPPILALGKLPTRNPARDWMVGSSGLHLGIGSQLIYNTESKQSVFFAALTAERFLTMIHLNTRGGPSDPHITALTIESTGTSELLRTQNTYFKYLPPDQQYDGGLEVAPGKRLASERLIVAAGSDYYGQLDAYGAAVRQLHRARVGAKATTMMGWQADMIDEEAITEGYARTNAQWMAEHLKKFGFNYIHLDADTLVPTGDVSSDTTHVPHGMRGLAHEFSQLGLRKAGWVQLLSVDETSFIYKEHKDWLVKNASGEPLWLRRKRPGGVQVNGYALDATHPGAQEYLRRIFRTMVREWGWHEIDLDEITPWSIEGYRYRPNTTAIEADRIAVQIIRETVGENVVLHQNSGLWLSFVGFVDTALLMDKFHTFSSTKEAGSALAGQYYKDHNFFVSDPGTICVEREPTTSDIQERQPAGPFPLEAAQASIVLSALAPGARFAIGDDLPTLGMEPERLALLTNPDLLQMVKLGRSARPLDLMTFLPEDEQPSIFFLSEDNRQSMLAVFNWTKQTHSHVVSLGELGLATGRNYKLYDVLDQSRPITLQNDSIHLENQAAESVILVKIIDETVAPAAPTIKAEAPEHAKVLEDVRFSVETMEESVPALGYIWDFGDGVTAEGPVQNHTYTKSGTYTLHLRVDGVDGVPAEKNVQITVDGLMEIAAPHPIDFYAD